MDVNPPDDPPEDTRNKLLSEDARSERGNGRFELGTVKRKDGRGGKEAGRAHERNEAKNGVNTVYAVFRRNNEFE